MTEPRTARAKAISEALEATGAATLASLLHEPMHSLHWAIRDADDGEASVRRRVAAGSDEHGWRHSAALQVRSLCGLAALGASEPARAAVAKRYPAEMAAATEARATLLAGTPDTFDRVEAAFDAIDGMIFDTLDRQRAWLEDRIEHRRATPPSEAQVAAGERLDTAIAKLRAERAAAFAEDPRSPAERLADLGWDRLQREPRASRGPDPLAAAVAAAQAKIMGG